MADVVYVHVGPPKTGTTYLQDRLHLNRADLAREGVRYPTGLAQDMFRPALDLVERPWGGMRADVGGEWGRLVRRVRRASGTAIVSHEVLAGATEQEAARAVRELAAGGTAVHVVLTARDLARQVAAEWQERLKHRRRVSFGKFVRRVRRNAGDHTPTGFWQVQDLPDVHRRWAAELDPARVHLVTVPPPGSGVGVLWERFCRAVGIDPSWAPHDSERRNPSIGAAESALLRRLNARLEQEGLASADYRSLVRQTVVHDALAHRAGMQPVILPPHARTWADEVAQSWMSWATETGVDVVGDLADLRPIWPDADVPWRDPDRPRPADVTSAAVDALTAVVLEASRRPDREAGLRARVDRIAERALVR